MSMTPWQTGFKEGLFNYPPSEEGWVPSQQWRAWFRKTYPNKWGGLNTEGLLAGISVAHLGVGVQLHPEPLCIADPWDLATAREERGKVL